MNNVMHKGRQALLNFVDHASVQNYHSFIIILKGK
jgi:hypothetical protein